MFGFEVRPFTGNATLSAGARTEDESGAENGTQGWVQLTIGYRELEDFRASHLHPRVEDGTADISSG